MKWVGSALGAHADPNTTSDVCVADPSGQKTNKNIIRLGRPIEVALKRFLVKKSNQTKLFGANGGRNNRKEENAHTRLWRGPPNIHRHLQLSPSALVITPEAYRAVACHSRAALGMVVRLLAYGAPPGYAVWEKVVCIFSFNKIIHKVLGSSPLSEKYLKKILTFI